MECKFEENEIVGKDVSDNMGKIKVVSPIWMHYDIPLPKHCDTIKAEKITVPFKGSDTKWVYLVRDVLTASECESLIKLSEKHGYVDALVNIGYGQQMKIESVRNCKRIMIDNHEMADHLWRRLQRFIPEIFRKRKKVSLNERLRFLRYHKHQYFAPHYDGTYVRDNKEELSQITVLIYLNDDYDGANTNFLDERDSNNKYSAKITQGMALLFEHHIYHEGAQLLNGVKYIIRTDVMYTYDEVEQENGDDNLDGFDYKPVDLMEKFMENIQKQEKFKKQSDNDGSEDEGLPQLFDISSNEENDDQINEER